MPGYLGRVAIDLDTFDLESTNDIFWYGILDFFGLCKVEELLIVTKSYGRFETEREIGFAEPLDSPRFVLLGKKQTEFVGQLLNLAPQGVFYWDGLEKWMVQQIEELKDRRVRERETALKCEYMSLTYGICANITIGSHIGRRR